MIKKPSPMFAEYFELYVMTSISSLRVVVDGAAVDGCAIWRLHCDTANRLANAGSNCQASYLS